MLNPETISPPLLDKHTKNSQRLPGGKSMTVSVLSPILLHGKAASKVSSSASSSILGISCSSSGEASSIQGLVLTSISHGLKHESIIKSYPKISKHPRRLFGFNFPLTAINEVTICDFIIVTMLLSLIFPKCFNKYSWNCLKDI